VLDDALFLRQIRFMMKNALYYLLMLGTLLSLAIPVTAQEETESEEAPTASNLDGEVFRVACTGRYPPFSYYDADGELVGFDVDVSKAVGEKLGRPTEVITTEWAGIIGGLQSGRYDAIIGSMGITPERQQQVLFSTPYYISGAQLFVLKENEDLYSSIDDMDGKIIGAGIGSTYQLYVEKNYPEIEVRSYDKEQEIFRDVLNGRLDGFVSDRLVGMWNIKYNELEFAPVGDLIYDERVAIPVRKDNPELLEDINMALAEMERDGTSDELYSKWFEEEQVIEEVPFSLEVEKLGKGLLNTLFAAVISISLGFLLAIPFGVGIKSAPPPFRWILKGINDFIRGTPVLVQLYFIYQGLPQIMENVFGFDQFAENFTPMMAGILTLMINCSAYMAEVVRAGLISVPNGQAIAGQSIGMSKFQTFRFIIWPQAFRVMIPPLMNSVVATMKDTALLSIISVAELVTEANKLISFTFDSAKYFFYVAILYFIISYPLMIFAQKLEDRIRQKGYDTNA